MTYPNQDYEDDVKQRRQELPANYEQFLTADREQFDQFLSNHSTADVLWFILKLLRLVLVKTRGLN